MPALLMLPPSPKKKFHQLKNWLDKLLIFIDENIPLITKKYLIHQGHDVWDIRGSALEGIPDDRIWDIVIKEKRLLITTDKGFAKYRNSAHYGILIIRLKRPKLNSIHMRIVETLEEFDRDDWQNKLVTVRDTVRSIWKV